MNLNKTKMLKMSLLIVTICSTIAHGAQDTRDDESSAHNRLEVLHDPKEPVSDIVVEQAENPPLQANNMALNPQQRPSFRGVNWGKWTQPVFRRYIAPEEIRRDIAREEARQYIN